jgi:hypothetical protein
VLGLKAPGAKQLLQAVCVYGGGSKRHPELVRVKQLSALPVLELNAAFSGSLWCVRDDGVLVNQTTALALAEQCSTSKLAAEISGKHLFRLEYPKMKTEQAVKKACKVCTLLLLYYILVVLVPKLIGFV